MSTHTPARSVRAVVSALVLALVGLGVSACSPGSPDSDSLGPETDPGPGSPRPETGPGSTG